MMDDRAVDSAARELLKLWESNSFGPRLPLSLRPNTPMEGWRVQRRVSALRVRPIVGWKCGLPREDRWVAAALHDALSSGAEVKVPVRTEGATVGVEPEWAFVLRRDLPPRAEPYGPDEIDAAIGGVHLAIEVVGCRYANPAEANGPELMADGLWHRALVVGPQIPYPPPASLTVTVDIEGQDLIHCQAKHVDADARRPLRWLAEFLRQQGMGLDAGQFVITGSLAGVIELPCGRPVALRYGDLGAVSLTLVSC